MDVRKIIEWVVPTVFLLGVILFQFQVPLSVISSEADVSAEQIAGKNYRMAGAIYLANYEGEFGSINQSSYQELVSNSGTACTLDLPGFGSDLGLYFQEDGICTGSVYGPVIVPVGLNKDLENSDNSQDERLYTNNDYTEMIMVQIGGLN